MLVKPKSSAPMEKEDHEQTMISFCLVIHNLLLSAGYVLALASMNGAMNVTFFVGTLLFCHLFLCEIFVRGLKKHKRNRVLPWFVVTAIEELVLLGMTIAHLSAYAEHHGNDSAKVFEDKTGILIISPALFLLRIGLWIKLAMSSWSYQYERLQ